MLPQGNGGWNGTVTDIRDPYMWTDDGGDVWLLAGGGGIPSGASVVRHIPTGILLTYRP